jgi:hypothetical protein
MTVMLTFFPRKESFSVAAAKSELPSPINGWLWQAVLSYLNLATNVGSVPIAPRCFDQ